MFRLLLLLLPVFLLTACPASTGDDDDSIGDDDDATGDDDDSTPYEPPGEWEDLEYLERLDYMEFIVMPEMEALFQEFDAELYKDFACETCHGTDPADHEHEMPGVDGPESLSIAEINGLGNDPDPDRARYADFMDEVKETMAPLVGEQPFPQGSFGCFACHEQE